MNIDNTPIWFVTGCSTGLGRAIAEYLLDNGFRVAATARRTDQISDLTERGQARNGSGRGFPHGHR
jgi:NADP-dependent 3-hydroxy acid dehydrogenase YdfG